MKKQILFTTLMAGMMLCSTAMADAVVKENKESKTGYTVSFDYTDTKATNVSIMGSFHFYEAYTPEVYANGIILKGEDKAVNYYVDPADWSADKELYHINDESYVAEMKKEGDTWRFDLDLPGGIYLYQYKVSYDGGETYEKIIDPTNIPLCNELGAHQTRSQFTVPYNPQTMSEREDWTFAMPAEKEEDRGTLVHEYYTGLFGQKSPVEIWLPAGYDPERKEPYKVLYLSHGYTGDEADWFYQGHAGNIMDRLVAEGKAEPFIMVAMNHTILNWDYNHMSDNLKSYLIPYIEANYNVSTKPEERAFVGLSMGGMTASTLYFRDPLYFGYYGILSGFNGAEFPELEDYSAYKKTNLFVGAGWGDFAVDSKESDKPDTFTVKTFAKKLDAAEIEYNNGEGVMVVPGSHDWFVWPRLLQHYIENVLWK